MTTTNGFFQEMLRFFRKMTTSNEVRDSILDVDDVQTSSNIYDDDDDGLSQLIIFLTKNSHSEGSAIASVLCIPYRSNPFPFDVLPHGLPPIGPEHFSELQSKCHSRMRSSQVPEWKKVKDFYW